MDRRQQKTRDSIFKAVGELLEHKRFEKITVHEIIDKANIGRSTFYAHFETKDALLEAMCTDIFDHIFSKDLMECELHEHTQSAPLHSKIEERLIHILYHLKESKHSISAILSGESRELFLRYLKEHLKLLFSMHLFEFQSDVPEYFLLNFIVGSFSSTIEWWIKDEMILSPEQTAEYFMKVTAKA